MKKRAVLIFFLSTLYFPNLKAQEPTNNHWSFEGNVFLGNILKVDSEIERILQQGTHRIYNFKLGYVTCPSDRSIFESDYNFPIIGIGFSGTDFIDVKITHSNINDSSRLANIYTLYGFIDRTLLRNKRLRLHYNLNAGLSFSPEPYDPIVNPNNEFVSSIIMVYVGFDIGVKYRLLNQLEIGSNMGVKHYSNGRMGMPNKGINIFGFDAGVRYYFAPPPEEYSKIKQGFKPFFYYNLSSAGGIQTSVQEWEIYTLSLSDSSKTIKAFKRYPKFSISSEIMCRTSRKYAIGIGLDLFYTPSIDKYKEWDRILFGEEKTMGVEYMAFSTGIAINQELYYKNLAIYASLGYYLRRELGLSGNESNFYQKAGFRYHFPSLHNLFIGYGIKAHNFRLAEYLELSIGMRFGLKEHP